MYGVRILLSHPKSFRQPVSLNSLFRVSWDGKGVKSERGSIRGLAASRAVDVQGLQGHVTKDDRLRNWREERKSME